MCNSFYLSGVVGKGGTISINEKADFKQFLKNKTGRKFTIRIDVHNGEKTKEFLGYYWGVIIPRIREGFKDAGTYLSKTACEIKCRKLCECYEETQMLDGTGYRRRLKGVSEMDKTELFEYVFRLKMLVAEMLNIYIDDPFVYLMD